MLDYCCLASCPQLPISALTIRSALHDSLATSDLSSHDIATLPTCNPLISFPPIPFLHPHTHAHTHTLSLSVCMSLILPCKQPKGQWVTWSSHASSHLVHPLFQHHSTESTPTLTTVPSRPFVPLITLAIRTSMHVLSFPTLASVSHIFCFCIISMFPLSCLILPYAILA